MNPAVQLREQYRLVFDQQSLELTLSEIARFPSWPEVIGTAPVGVAVDHDSHVKDHDPSQIAASHDQQVSYESNCKRSPARLPMLAPADEERDQEQDRCADVQSGMKSADGFLGRINVQPVHQARGDSTRCPCHANPDSYAASQAKLWKLEQQRGQI